MCSLRWMRNVPLACSWPVLFSSADKRYIFVVLVSFVTRLTRWVPLEEQELPTLSEHMSTPPDCSGVRITRSLVLYVCFVDRCLSLCTFSFGHCVVCSSSIYGFWLPPFGIFKLSLNVFICNKHHTVDKRGIFDNQLGVLWVFPPGRLRYRSTKLIRHCVCVHTCSSSYLCRPNVPRSC